MEQPAPVLRKPAALRPECTVCRQKRKQNTKPTLWLLVPMVHTGMHLIDLRFLDIQQVQTVYTVPNKAKTTAQMLFNGIYQNYKLGYSCTTTPASLGIHKQPPNLTRGGKYVAVDSGFPPLRKNGAD